MSKQNPPPRWANLSQAAELYGVHPRTIRRRIAEGVITGYRIAGTRAIRVDLNEVEAVMMRPIVSVNRREASA